MPLQHVQVVPFDSDEDDEKMAESEHEEEVQEQKEDVQEDEELEEVKKKKWPETFRQTSINRRMSTVEKWRNRKDQTLTVKKWSLEERICPRTMYKWIEEYPKYKNFSMSHKKRI